MNAMMTDLPFISIIIPTYNRAAMLPLTLDSLVCQRYPSDKFEIIVCDNNSSDATPLLLEEYTKKYPNKIVRILEKRQGVHFARNTAAHHAKGDILYYTDDDMLADKNVLAAFASLFIRHPSIGSATGKVLPKWEETPPHWIVKLCTNGYLSLIDLGNVEQVCSKNMGVYSCHQALRRAAFWGTGGFNPENTAGEWIGDGETGLNIKIADLGYSFGYTPKAVTWHMIPKSRMTQEYLSKRLANQGNCDSYTSYRTHRYSLEQLAANMVTHSLKAEEYKSLYEKQMKEDNIEWHVSLALVRYHLSRFKYDKRLATDSNWRQLVLKDDWLQTT